MVQIGGQCGQAERGIRIGGVLRLDDELASIGLAPLLIPCAGENPVSAPVVRVLELGGGLAQNLAGDGEAKRLEIGPAQKMQVELLVRHPFSSSLLSQRVRLRGPPILPSKRGRAATSSFGS